MVDHRHCPSGHPLADTDRECPTCGTMVPDDAIPPPTTPVLPAVPGFEVVDEIGRGGMGIVYKARQLKLDRPVALKMIHGGRFARPEAVERFRSEARAAAQVKHANVVEIHEVVEHEGHHFLVLEYVDGGSLDRVLAGKPQPPQSAAALLERLARAVHAVHLRDIIHRDLKPANILLQLPASVAALLGARPGAATDPGDGGPPPVAYVDLDTATPKIADFGLAKLLGEDTGQSRSGVPLGTPSYMAPEQASGRLGAIGRAADVYALGAILYELLTGRPPFLGATATDTIQQVIEQDAVSPRRLNPRVPRNLETICLMCLRKEPGRRYATAEALANDLGRYQRGEPIEARPVGRVERTWMWVRRNPAQAASASLLVTMLIGTAFLVAILLSKGEVENLNHNLQIALGEAEKHRKKAEDQARTVRRYQYIADMNLARRALEESRPTRALKLLGGHAAKEGDAGPAGPEWHYLWRQAHPGLLRVSAADGHAPVTRLVLSPDGKRAAVLCGASVGRDFAQPVQLWDLVDARRVQTLTGPGGTITALAYQPAGKFLALGGSGGRAANGPAFVILYDAATGQELRRLKGEMAAGADERRPRALDPGAITDLACSRDGRWLIAVGKEEGRDSERVVTKPAAWLWDLDALDELPRVLALDAEPTAVAIHPNGRQAAIALGARRQAVLWDFAADQQRPLARGHRFPVRAVAYSPDGRWLATAGGKDAGEIKVWDPASGEELLTLEGQPRNVAALAFSPDGRRLATGADDGIVRVWDLAARLLPTRPRTAFAEVSPAVGPAPAARPDVAGEQDEPPTLYRGHEGAVAGLAFSPDGTALATGAADGRLLLWDTTADQESVPALLGPSAPVAALGFGADGRVCYLAADTLFAWDPSGARDAVERPLDSGKDRPFTRTFLRQLAGRTGLAAFSADGQWLAVIRRDDPFEPREAERTQIQVWDVPALLGARPPTEPARRLIAAAQGITCLAFRPDGQELAAGGENRTVLRWDLAAAPGKETLPSLTGHAAAVTCLAYSADGKRLAVAAGWRTRSAPQPGELRVWDTAAGRVLQTVPEPELVSCLAFSPDGWQIASGHAGGTIRLWPMDDSAEPILVSAHTGEVTSLAFNPKGDRLVSGGADRTLHVWDAATGEELLGIARHAGAVTRLAVSRDGHWLASGGAVGPVRAWDCRPASPLTPSPAVALARQRLAWHRYQLEQDRADGHWFAAEFHSDRLLQTLAEPELFAARAQARAELGRWLEARADFAECLRRRPDDLEARLHLARLALLSDDARYGEVCAELLRRAAKSDDPAEVGAVAWVCILGASKQVDPAATLEVADKAVGLETPVFLRTRGAALLRAGRYTEAVKALTAAARSNGPAPADPIRRKPAALTQGPDPDASRSHPGQADGTPREWLLLALAHHHLGDAGTARQLLAWAARRLDSAELNGSLSWSERVDLSLLRGEAEELIEGRVRVPNR